MRTPHLAAIILLCSFPPACRRALPTQEELGRRLKPGERIVSYQRETLEGLGREIVRARILDESTQRITETIHDARGMERLAYPALRERDRQALRSRHGAGGLGFDARMDSRPATALPFTVQFMPGTSADLAAREIAQLGATIESRAGDIAAIRALPAVARRIARLPSVQAIVEERPKQNLAVFMARDLGQATLAAKHVNGFGRELTAAIWELDACVNRKHSDFQKVQWLPNLNPGCDPRLGIFHSTMAANAFAAFRSDGTAGLFQGRMFDVDDKNKEATADMFRRAPNVINASFTLSIFDGKVVDTEVYQRRIHVFNGAGNTAGEITACHAQNALCVGGYDNSGTIAAFADDRPAGSSSANFFGREVPQIVGPFTVGKLATEFFSGAPPRYAPGSGTSFATPAIAGLAALLIANYPFDLTGEPQAVRAVLLASAQAHPIPVDGRTVPDFNDGIDDRTGAGAPNGDRAHHIMDTHSSRHGTFLPTLPGQPGLRVVTFPTAGNERIRVVLTWEQCPDYVIGSPELFVDLDLVVRAPAGPPIGQTTAHTNISRHDNWEIVEFNALRGGTVAIHVSAPVAKPCPSARDPRAVHFGLAWTSTPFTLNPGR